VSRSSHPSTSSIGTTAAFATRTFYETCDFFVVFENGRVLEKIVKNGDSYSPRMDILYLFERR